MWTDKHLQIKNSFTKKKYNYALIKVHAIKELHILFMKKLSRKFPSLSSISKSISFLFYSWNIFRSTTTWFCGNVRPYMFLLKLAHCICIYSLLSVSFVWFVYTLLFFFLVRRLLYNLSCLSFCLYVFLFLPFPFPSKALLQVIAAFPMDKTFLFF